MKRFIEIFLEYDFKMFKKMIKKNGFKNDLKK